jgi:hypothetical protein
MFRFVYYCTLKQQIWELEMAIQRVTHWLTSGPRWKDVHSAGYVMKTAIVKIEIRENIEEFHQRMREHKAMLSTDKCTLQTLKKELYDSYTTLSYSTLRRRTPNIYHYSDWME